MLTLTIDRPEVLNAMHPDTHHEFADAKLIGLLNEVVPLPELMSRARLLAQEILACAPLAVQASKQVMLQSLGRADLASTMHEDDPLAQCMRASDDAREGPKAFAQKHTPNWTGH